MSALPGSHRRGARKVRVAENTGKAREARSEVHLD
jgi:hypothetical protein